jgi:hypothetical protein
MFTLYGSYEKNNMRNVKFPRKTVINDRATFARFVLNDHLMSCFTTDSVRRKECFVSSNLLFGDVDNDKISDPAMYITLDDIKRAFSGYEVWIATSKSHMIDKVREDGTILSARPKYHLYFPIAEITDMELFEKYLCKLMDTYAFLYLDPACKNSNRVFFATIHPEITILQGRPITEALDLDRDDDDEFINYARSWIEADSDTMPARTSNIFEECSGLSDGRKAALFRYACSCKARGFQDNEIIEECYRLNSTFSPPHSRDIVERAARGAIRSDRIKRGERMQYSPTTPMQPNPTSSLIAEKKTPTSSEVFSTILPAIVAEIDAACALVGGQVYYVRDGFVQKVAEFLQTVRTKYPVISYIRRNPKVIKGKKNEAEGAVEWEESIATVDPLAHWIAVTNERYRRLSTSYRTTDRAIQYDSFVNDFNSFAGGIQRPEGSGTCETYLKHLREIVCHNSAELFDYLIQWLAQIVQNPEKRPETAIVLRGGEGRGKSIVFEYFGDILGRKYSAKLEGLSQLTEQFNSLLLGKVFVLVAEAEEEDNSFNKFSPDKFKSFITDKYMTVRPMNVARYEVENRVSYAIVSNHTSFLKLSAGDRRYCIVDVGDWENDAQQERKLLNDHFEALHRERDNGGPAALYDYLMALKITVDFRNGIPTTDIKQFMVADSATEVVQFVSECFRGEMRDEYDVYNIIAANNGTISTKEFFSRFESYFATRWKNRRFAKNTVRRDLKKSFGDAFYSGGESQGAYYGFDMFKMLGRTSEGSL